MIPASKKYRGNIRKIRMKDIMNFLEVRLVKSGELASLLGVTEPSLRAHWGRIKASQEKQGVFLYKRGRGEEAEYGIKYPWEYEVIWDTDELSMM